jgi:glycosyltransferase involved in cell wall biosynthesis
VTGSADPLVAICMAAYDPDPALVARQIASIRAQSHGSFACVVNDDASSQAAYSVLEDLCGEDDRLSLHRNERRLGFYRNFERCLSLVPTEADFVAFSDQDDVWHSDKLETLVDAVKGSGANLAYADMNIATDDGRLLAPSYWTDRRNNWTDLGSLLLINTVTGAASLFRRDLLDDALPFPAATGEAYHDHWIACLALASGAITFVDRPLHDYVQHGANIVGRHEPLPGEFKGGLVNAARRFIRNPRRRWANTVGHARRYYVDEVVPRERFAQALEQRLAGRMTPEKARAVRRVARMSSSPASLAWLFARSARDVRGESETLGIENQLIKGILWHWQDVARRRLLRS